MAEIPCPMCGKLNPADAETCQFCSARIKPMVARSQPENDGIPDWLASLRGAQDQAGEPEPFSFSDSSSPDDWLSRIGLGVPPAEPAAPVQPSPPPPAAEMPFTNPPDRVDEAPKRERPFEEPPDWLESMRQAVSPEQTSPGSESPSPAPEPDWLASFRGSEGEAETPEKHAAPFAEDSTDDWLARFNLAGTGQANTPTPSVSPEVPPLPDWLADTPSQMPGAPVSAAPFATGDLQPASSEEELPDWMKILQTPPPAAAGSQPAGGEPGIPTGGPTPEHLPEQESTEFVNFLKGASQAESAPSPFDDLAPAPSQPAAAPEAGFPDLSTGAGPDWLTELEARAGAGFASFGEEPQVAPLEETPLEPAPEAPAPAQPFISSTMPDWLGELGDAERSQDGAVETEHGEMLLSADLPSWVQALRPVETVAPAPPAQAPGETGSRVEERGPLAGLRGILPGEPVIAPNSKGSAFATRLDISERQQLHLEILQEMLDSEDKPEALSPEPAISSQRMLRWAIAGVLILVLLIPLLGGVQVFPVPTSAPGEVADLQSSVQALPLNAPVLLVADYSPAVVGEAQAAGSAVVTDLLRKGARLAVISTTPTGPALANALIQGLLPDSVQNAPAYAGTEKIVHLGYLPGGVSSLAAFIANPKSAVPFTVESKPAWEQPALQGVQKFSDFARVVVITDNGDTGRAWIEQAQPQLGTGSSILLIAGAQAAPVLRPYLNSHQVRGMVAGIAGGAAYEALDQRPGTGQTYWNAFQFGIWIAVLMIVVGAVATNTRPILDAIQGLLEGSA